MAIFTRKAISGILADENLTPEERTERVFTLYGQALDEGYLSKSAAQAAQNAAIEAAKAEAVKDIKAPNIQESEEYKALMNDFNAYKARQTARHSDDFAGVKDKFFDAVYDMVDKDKPIPEQLSTIREKYEEYFTPDKDEKPEFGGPTQGAAPTGKTGQSFSDLWGFVPKK